MKKVMVVLAALFGLVVLSGLITAGKFVGFNNECVQQENDIKAQFSQNQNNYDAFFKKVNEIAQVPSMYVDDLKKVYSAALSSRYGANGSKAVFQFIKEHNPEFDASLYKKLQQVIEAGRNDFEENQKLLIDKKATYQTYLQIFPNSLLSAFMGFPKIKLDDYKLVLSDETDKAFKDGKAAPLKLR